MKYIRSNSYKHVIDLDEENYEALIKNQKKGTKGWEPGAEDSILRNSKE